VSSLNTLGSDHRGWEGGRGRKGGGGRGKGKE